jgi:hypothetical protein
MKLTNGSMHKLTKLLENNEVDVTSQAFYMTYIQLDL